MGSWQPTDPNPNPNPDPNPNPNPNAGAGPSACGTGRGAARRVGAQAADADRKEEGACAVHPLYTLSVYIVRGMCVHCIRIIRLRVHV